MIEFKGGIDKLGRTNQNRENLSFRAVKIETLPGLRGMVVSGWEGRKWMQAMEKKDDNGFFCFSYRGFIAVSVRGMQVQPCNDSHLIPLKVVAIETLDIGINKFRHLD
ncbi:hypothetical protein LINGRAHAP2_LOCUS37049 [Linum grandiflorum]